MAKEMYELRIELLRFKPTIWREILVSSTITLVDFHRVLQTVMGWQNAHLHLFQTSETEYSPREFEVEDTKDSRSFRLRKILRYKDQSIKYLYDFGDYWEHLITLKAIHYEFKGSTAPICLRGERACPPEDCGGFSGYEEFLRIMANPRHPEHKSMKIWFGGKFDPEEFSTESVNYLLGQKDYGCIWEE